MLPETPHFAYPDENGYPVEDFASTGEDPFFCKLGSQALSSERIIGEYDPTPLAELPVELHGARDTYLAALKKRASADGVTFDNNLSYSLFRIAVDRPQDEVTGKRITVYRLLFRPTDYEHFQFPNNALDKPIEVNGRTTTAREALQLQPHRLSLARLYTSPCHFKLGTGTVILTKKESFGGEEVEGVVVSIRSKRQLMVGRNEGASYHLSAAEGMLRPDDGPAGRPSPFHTCLRSLQEELGLTPGVHFDPNALRCLGLYLDTKRAQPFVPFFLRTNLAAAEVQRCWQFKAEHRHENDRLLVLPWTEDTANLLINGNIEADGKHYHVASNHAKLGFLLAAAHEHELRGEQGQGGFLFSEAHE